MTQTRMSHQVACLPSDTAPHIHLIFTYARSVSKCSAHFVLLFYPLLSCQRDRPLNMIAARRDSSVGLLKAVDDRVRDWLAVAKERHRGGVHVDEDSDGVSIADCPT